MAYLVHTAHAQLSALWLALMGWTLTAVALGLVDWRVWRVDDTGVITSGVVWVGLWRACFHSYAVVSPGLQMMFCKAIDATEAFAPPEIIAGQVLMLMSLLVGLCGNVGGFYSMRNVYFGVEKLWFVATGVLCLLAAAMSLVPLLWNLTSVATNQTINFPPDFQLPPAPASQYIGSGIAVGMVGTILMIISGIIFCAYKAPDKSKPATRRSLATANGSTRGGASKVLDGNVNPVFEFHEQL